MTEPGGVLPDINLLPGELYLARRPAILRTLLGSCVGVTIWCARLKAGALSHGVLPYSPIVWPAGSTVIEGFRYVDFSIRYLVQQFDRLGARRQELEVKLFGGADVLPQLETRQTATIGAINVAAAEEVLAEAGLTPLVRDVRGDRGRRVHFHVGSGHVIMKRLRSWQDRDPSNQT